MPGTTPPNKIAATKGYGAEVIFSGPQFEDREVVAAKVVNDTGARLVPPHGHPDIILGQATAGLEFQQQVKMPTSFGLVLPTSAASWPGGAPGTATATKVILSDEKTGHDQNHDFKIIFQFP
ncbi:hypothetical protein CEP51_013093 [Fusarium floridanum]|uniref:Tryptophan synthase beta chain-like PALP domain-containing protein n=1 Tax=Fusarium floridanum TaxID=1325733 RepID=A0A428QHY1_9HYPO|nr:hypothetical protein CEP51_013093 [Fusarium floridanum]